MSNAADTRSKAADRQRKRRLAESEEERKKRNATNASRTAAKPDSEEAKNQRKATNASRTAVKREAENEMERNQRLEMDAQQTSAKRKAENEMERNQRLEMDAQQTSAKRKAENEMERNQRLEMDAQQTSAKRKAEDNEKKRQRLDLNAQRNTLTREAEDDVRKRQRLASNAQRNASKRKESGGRNHIVRLSGRKAATTEDEVDIDTIRHYLGEMNVVCSHCQASHWAEEKSSKSTIANPKFSQCCCYGEMPIMANHTVPPLLEELTNGTTPRSRTYRNQSRQINQALSFTSTGIKVDDSINKRGPYCFRINGAWMHKIGNWMPDNGMVPKFAQIFTIDTEQEQLECRMMHMPAVDMSLVKELQAMLSNTNPFVTLYRNAKMVQEENPTEDIKILMKADIQGLDRHRYNKPTASDVGAVIIGNETDDASSRDIVLHKCDGTLRRINETHASYDSLHYTLLFPYGEPGFHSNIKRETTGTRKRTNVTLREYYAHRMHVRESTLHIFGSGRIFLQYIVDMGAKIESYRLNFIRNHQSQLRAELYSGIVDAVASGDNDPKKVGQRVVLPATFTGSDRHVHQLYQDSMAIVRKYGAPDVFLTITANPAWTEITENLLPGQSASERPDLVCRVFQLKLKSFCHDIFTVGVIGSVVARIQCIEFQKRGLPHSHILPHKLRTPEDVNSLVRAEIPDPDTEPVLHGLVKKFMCHGPCGAENPNSPCMQDGQCRHRFPRPFTTHTSFTDGYPVYRRLNNGRTVTLNRGGKEVHLDNSWVVPYCPFLLLRYQCHINAEVCGTIRAVKYLHKYLYKGGDRTLIKLSTTTDKDVSHGVDEVQRYLDSRWLSSHEAVWRTLEYKLHDNSPNVIRLAVHLEHQEFVHFREDGELQDIAQYGPPKTTLTSWFAANQKYPQGRNLTYLEFCTKFWYTSNKVWAPRKTGTAATVGRMRTVQPNQTELYYLRLLLCHVVGALSYEDVRTVDGVIHSTFHGAAVAMGIAVNDNEWKLCLQEAIEYKSGRQLRLLFCTILEFCLTESGTDLWDAFKFDLLEDILHSRRRHVPEATFHDILNEGLIEINSILTGFGRSLEDFAGMPQLDNQTINQEIVNERSHTIVNIEERLQQLNNEQTQVYQTIDNAVTSKSGQMFFIDAQGGCGKTFVLNVIIDSLRARGFIVLATASSGVAAILLNGGRTAHSTFRMPVTRMDINSRCAIKSQSKRGDLIRCADLLIWDEAPMTSWMHIRCVDKSLQDLTGSTKLFGGKVIVFAGDFRQTLPVIPRASRDETIRQCLKFWEHWQEIMQLKLNKNIRVEKITTTANKVAQSQFIEFLTSIGNGNHEEHVHELGHIITAIPICMQCESVEDLINFVYPNFVGPGNENCAILAPKNEQVDSLNADILERVPGVERVYLSVDSVVEDECQTQYPTEYLNSVNFGGLPPHRLSLKPGVPIILLRNLNPAGGLANGTRLICVNLQQHSIQARIVTGPKTGDVVIIPRIKLTPSDARLPFTLKRHQFPVKLNYAMTINKAQGQTLERTGLMLSSPCFSHGQLYVAMSRVGCKDNIKVYAPQQPDGLKQNETMNIVYDEVIGHTKQ